MNTSEYIESGTLELYTTGLLSTEEMRDVELQACLFPEIKTELQALQVAMEAFAQKHAIAPRPEVKQRIMMAIERNAGLENKNEVQKNQEAVVREITSAKIIGNRFLVAASIGLWILVGTIAAHFATQSFSYKRQVAQLNEQQNAAQKELSDLKQSLNLDGEQLAVLTHDSTVRVVMNGTPKHSGNAATIYWNKMTKVVYLDVKTLPPAVADKQYQLWFINPAGTPINAGVFDIQTGQLQKMISAPAAVAFAVTLEPKGGSENPTMDQMYVVGTVGS